MNEIMATFFLYYRLVLYPMLAYTLVLEGLSVVDCPDGKRIDKAYVLSALFFMMLWATSVLALIVRSNDVIIVFNRYTLLPVGTILLIYLWTRLIGRCRADKKRLIKLRELE